MDHIDELRVFVAVADLRGFAQAGRRLGMSPAQVSKLIARLEDRLNSRLFNRTTRDVSLTDEGRALHARARVLVEEYDQFERSAQETAKPRGLLKLSAPISFGQQLGPALIDFASAYPEVALGWLAQIEQRLTKRPPSIVPKMWNGLQNNASDKQ